MATKAEETLTADQLTAVYLKIRNAKREKEDQLKQELKALNDQLEVVESELLKICNDLNVETMRTPHGTVSRTVKERYWCSDWESMHKFILENEAPFLLEQRISNGNMKEFLEQNPDMHPIGLQSERKYAVQVRKPTNK